MKKFTLTGDPRDKIEWVRCKPCGGTGRQLRRTFRSGDNRCGKCQGDGLMPRRVVFLDSDRRGVVR